MTTEYRQRVRDKGGDREGGAELSVDSACAPDQEGTLGFLLRVAFWPLQARSLGLMDEVCSLFLDLLPAAGVTQG